LLRSDDTPLPRRRLDLAGKSLDFEATFGGGKMRARHISFIAAVAFVLAGCVSAPDPLRQVSTQSISSTGKAIVVARMEAHNYNFISQDLVAPGVVVLVPKPGSTVTEPIVLWPGRAAPPPPAPLTGTPARLGPYMMGEAGPGWSKANATAVEVTPGEYHLTSFQTHSATWFAFGSDVAAGRGRYGTITVAAGEVVNIGALHYYMNEKTASVPAGHKGRFEVVADETAARGFLTAHYPSLAGAMITRPITLTDEATKPGGPR
jgi:hypothetical protein